MADIPVTSNAEFQIMKPGLHVVKIKSIEINKKKDGEHKTDKRGHPSIFVDFINKDKETIRAYYYYCTAPLNDPIRSDPMRRCASEWILTNLKLALNYNPGDAIKEEDAKKKKIFILVQKETVVDSNGNKVDDKIMVSPMHYMAAEKNGVMIQPPAVNNDEIYLTRVDKNARIKPKAEKEKDEPVDPGIPKIQDDPDW